jgi:hypothetical protein
MYYITVSRHAPIDLLSRPVPNWLAGYPECLRWIRANVVSSDRMWFNIKPMDFS